MCDCCRAVVEGLYSSFSLQQSLQQNVYLDISRCVLTTGKRPPNTSHVFPIPYSSHGKSWGCPTSSNIIVNTVLLFDIMTDVSSADSMAGIQAGDELAKKRR